MVQAMLANIKAGRTELVFDFMAQGNLASSIPMSKPKSQLRLVVLCAIAAPNRKHRYIERLHSAARLA